MSVKRVLVFLFLMLWILESHAVAHKSHAIMYKPKICIIATGGTIAGMASSITEAAYNPAQLTVETLIAQVPEITERAHITGLQLCNIASQHITVDLWIRMAQVIDSLFIHSLCDGVVITHGTDTMEETAFFLDLILRHNKPVVFTGSMRPANNLGADGPANLYNAVCLATEPSAGTMGVLAVMNDYIFAASEFTKMNTVNPHAFESPDFGPMGTVRGGRVQFFRTQALGAKTALKCTTEQLKQLAQDLQRGVFPRVEIVASYADAPSTALDALLASGVDGIVIAGVGHGNYSRPIEASIYNCLEQGVFVVRATRASQGGVTYGVEDPFAGQLVSGMLSPQKARILLMLALTRYRSLEELETIFNDYSASH
ncbi:MAG: asparaginase [Bacteroidales bacterium]|nr:asparaginase [Bacteroidales bacterium]